MFSTIQVYPFPLRCQISTSFRCDSLIDRARPCDEAHAENPNPSPRHWLYSHIGLSWLRVASEIFRCTLIPPELAWLICYHYQSEGNRWTLPLSSGQAVVIPVDSPLSFKNLEWTSWISMSFFASLFLFRITQTVLFLRTRLHFTYKTAFQPFTLYLQQNLSKDVNSHHNTTECISAASVQVHVASERRQPRPFRRALAAGPPHRQRHRRRGHVCVGPAGHGAGRCAAGGLGPALGQRHQRGRGGLRAMYCLSQWPEPDDGGPKVVAG